MAPSSETFSVRANAADLFENLEEAKGIPYILKRADGILLEGSLDSYGRTERIYSVKPEDVTLLIGDGEWDIFDGVEYD